MERRAARGAAARHFQSMTTCRYCRLPHVPGDGHYAECIVIRRIFGPPSRMCRRCANDAAPRRLLCAECQVKYKPVFYRPAALRRDYLKRKAGA